MIKRFSCLLSALCCILPATLLFSTPVFAQDEEGWQFAAGIYGWLPNINIKESSGKKVGLSRQDILDNLDPSFLGSFTVGRGRYYAGLDFIYLNLSEKDNDEVIPGTTLRKTEITSYLINPVLGYRVYDGARHKINVEVGARYFKQELDLSFRFDAPLPPGSDKLSASDDVWDAMVGLNGRYELSNKWFSRYFLEAGTGDSDLVWGYAATAGYQFSGFDLEAGWRDLHYEFDSDSDFKRIDFPGPYLGANFYF